MLFKTRPREIHAYQYKEGTDLYHLQETIFRETSVPLNFKQEQNLESGDNMIHIATLNGPQRLYVGDWIVVSNGECYPVKAEIFRKNYFPADAVDTDSLLPMQTDELLLLRQNIFQSLIELFKDSFSDLQFLPKRMEEVERAIRKRD